MKTRMGWCSIVLITFCCITKVQADTTSVSPYSSAIAQELILDIILNQSKQDILGQFLQKNNQLLIARETLEQLKIRLPQSADSASTDYVLLEDVPSLSYEYDSLNQRIYLNVDVEALNSISRYQAYTAIEPAKIDPNQDKPGTLLNYDFYGQYSADAFTLSGANEYRVFGLGEGGIFSLSANYNYSRSNRESNFNSQILDIFWQKDFPERMLSLKIGDDQSRQLNWSRSTRISGLSFAKNFSLQPYRIITPLESFKGQVSLPSTVDLFINGLKQTTQQVVPGKFEIETVPVLSGTGEAQLILTDINGQQRVVSFSLYGTNELLQKGLDDWSLNLGYTRLDYGQSSFRYDQDMVANGTYRYGLTQDLTIESHIELAPELSLLGGGVVQRLGNRAGVLNAAYAYSQYQNSEGYIYQLGYNWSSRYLNFFYNTLRQSGDFYDIARIHGSIFPERSDQFFLGFNNPLGQFGASYVYQQYSFSVPNQFLTFNWSYSFANSIFLNLSANYDLNQENTRYFLSLNIPLEKRRNVNLSLQQDQNQEKWSFNARQSIPRDMGGWGWQVQADVSEDNRNLQAQIGKVHNYGEWSAGVQNFNSGQSSSTVTTGTANGSILMMKNSLLPMRRTYDSFALISTSKVPDVPVKLENRYIGKTNKNGILVVDALNSYQHNQISIDPLELPVDYHIETTKLNAVPRYGSGVYIEFPIYQVKTVQMILKDKRGDFIEAGSNIWTSPEINTETQQPLTIVAHEGIVYLESPKNSKLYVQQKNSVCSFEVPDLSQKNGLIDLGELVCE
ncbi:MULTISPECIES: fimbria/pilus outer membrane usher protein [Acinetobacter Taxon 24]|jgi:outer membrane usher protein|uniref:Fimbria/pilus outer membrane usher protein n=2 Tax=Acinetobacter Taxon 24 TaxID=2839056 RepID=A0AAW6UU23_9GAMM|nr:MULTISPECIES: fimbria/pilus outer membrane usher protein [Acinetobacter Taxon 24]MDK1685188.1 fimbria/pilus outer membrane usher protein [Acinetobacter terrestris]TCB58395.1 fimbrial biogenesis outer membrane usher protein [Acinetobacter terrae]